MVKKITVSILCISLLIIINKTGHAIEIKEIKLIGNTVDLNISNEIKTIKGQLSRKDIEALGVKITDEYHDKGYTTSYVEKLIARKNGVLEIHIKESMVLGINISGLESEDKKEIEYSFSHLTNRIFNKYNTERIAGVIKNKYNLGSIKIYPVNYKDSGDIFLSIKLTEKSRGNFYGGIGFEPIYGIAPELGYYYPFTTTALDLYSRAGYREGKFRRAEGDLKFFIFPGEGASGIYIGSNISMFLEEWESRNYEYKRTSLAPVLGYRSVHQYIMIDLYVTEIISNIENYEDNDEKFRDYDTRGTLEIGISNRSNLLSKKDATKIAISVSSGINDLNDKAYVLSSGEIKSAISPFTWLRFIPGIYSYYTISDERYFWQYVFDKRMLGFFDDYTASKWRNIAGLEIEIEIIPQFFHMGPFTNYGYFLNEFDEWKSRTGTGVKGSFEFEKLYLEVYYAWNASKSPSKGGLSILAGGRF